MDANDYDWVQVSPGAHGVLHAPQLSPKQSQQLDEEAYLEAGAVACGRKFTRMRIPGPGSRMGNRRCMRCCERTGYPYGLGSPKNDPIIRAMLGI